MHLLSARVRDTIGYAMRKPDCMPDYRSAWLVVRMVFAIFCGFCACAIISEAVS